MNQVIFPSTDAHIVKWSPDGNNFVLVVNDKIDIYKLETATVIGTITNPKRISSLKFLNVSFLNRGLHLLIAQKHHKCRSCEFKQESFRTPSWPSQETMKTWGCTTWEKPNGCVSSRLMKPGKSVPSAGGFYWHCVLSEEDNVSIFYYFFLHLFFQSKISW